MAEGEGKKSGEQPIIIKKIKKGGHGHHGGAWKVAYADFVTAMMAFFIVMWILGQSDEVKQQVSEYFNDPMAFSVFTGERKSGSVPVELDLPSSYTGRREGSESDNVFKFDSETTDTLFKRIMQQASNDSVRAAERVTNVSNEIGKMLQNLQTQQPDLKTVLENIKIEMTKEGMRIELLESSENCFFEIGSPNLSKQAIEILKILASEIGKLPNFVDLEGHTDSRGYKSNTGYTNWDLSTDRANAARKLLQTNGFWDGQVTQVAGYADQRLRNPDNPFDMNNRRVSIVVKHIAVNQFLPQVQGATNE